MALKLDMSKAYAWVEWPFLKGVMRRMGFTEEFVQLVMKFATMVSRQFRINGDIYDVVVPGRGLRQGTRSRRTYFSCVRRVSLT